MPSIRAVVLLLILPLGVSRCAAYDPPAQADHTTTTYKADLEKCRTDSTETVRRRNADNPGTWIISPFTGPPAVRSAIRTCMTAKGYLLDKTGG